MNFLASNFKFLREKIGLNQVQISVSLGFNRSTWNNYETGKSKPSLDDFILISKYFRKSASELLEMDLSNVHLNKNIANENNAEYVHLNVHPNVHLNEKKALQKALKEVQEKENLLQVNKQLLHAKTQLIDTQQAQISLLQNQIKTMQYELAKHNETQHTHEKERKSA